MTKTASFLLAAGLFGLSACSAPSPDAPQGEPATHAATAGLTVQAPAARATPGGAKIAAGYLTLVNGSGEADALLSAASPRAARVELHEMAMDGDMMRMRPVARIPVPAGGQVQLKPGGLHLMFVGITAPFTEGETIPVTLTFEKAGAMEVSLPVKRIGPGAGADEHAGH
jgi:periplasmic copper chaperone A